MGLKITRLSLFFIIFFCSLVFANPSTVELRHALRKIRLHYGASAATLTIAQAGHKALTFYDGQVRVGNLFQVGSITKSFIAALLVKLQDQGRLTLDDPITRYLPQYVKWHDITIRELLNHTSGIYNYTRSTKLMDSIRDNPKSTVTPPQLVHVAYEKPLQFQPGKGWYYSNTNYIVAGMIIRKVTHQDISHCLQHEIIEPLDLHNTYYFPDRYPLSIERQMVTGYTPNGEPIRDMNVSWLGAAGALNSNSPDIATWVKALFYHRIISAADLQEMIRAVSTKNGKPLEKNSHDSGYGLGLKYRFDQMLGPIWFHPGITSGFTAFMAWLPHEHLAIALLINRDVNSVKTANHLADPVFALYHSSHPAD